MAYSDTVGGTAFNALKVVDHAFRRCRLPAQAITAEMQSYALDSLYVMLSELSNIKTPSWCIEKMVLPMYQNQPIVPLPVGTVEVLNLNYRTLQVVSGANVTASNLYQTNFTTSTTVDTVGIEWAGVSVPLYFQVSANGSVWVTVGAYDADNVAGEISWTDVSGALAYPYFRIQTQNLSDVFSYTVVTLGNMPQEIPLGQLNRDSYVNQSNKVFPGRPSNYYFQRDLPLPVVNLWPAPFSAAEQAQLVLWRHRQIMDTQNLRQDVEVPPRWLEAIIDGLAARVAAETPQVDPQIMMAREQKATLSLQRAWDGDNDGSPIQINPGIGVYTK